MRESHAGRAVGSGRVWLIGLLALVGIAGVTVLLLALLTNIFERKQEARQPFVRMVEVTEDTMDPKVWGQNWSFQYDSYLKTSLPTTTKYGGRGLGASDGGPPEQKLDREPWLKRIFGLRVRPGLPRSTRPLLRPLRPGTDPARDRAAAARGVPSLPRRESRPLPLRREGRRPERLRAGLGHAVPGSARLEGRQG